MSSGPVGPFDHKERGQCGRGNVAAANHRDHRPRGDPEPDPQLVAAVQPAGGGDGTTGFGDDPQRPDQLAHSGQDLGLADRHDGVQPFPQVGEGQLGQRGAQPVGAGPVRLVGRPPG